MPREALIAKDMSSQTKGPPEHADAILMSELRKSNPPVFLYIDRGLGGRFGYAQGLAKAPATATGALR